ncbi:MAG: hypothetical protein JWO35_157 [Candidatus Saccharibacteria bacterium]|nr:hypothetical protein [Candidatus Saccharibacteria bacterium]
MRRKLKKYQAFVTKRPKLMLEIGFFLLTLLVVCVSLSPVLRQAGWPQNHEGFAFIDRIAVYADHMRQGDLFPVWSSADGIGMGTPLPLFYHKLFYMVTGPVYMLSNSIKFTLIFGIGLFMTFGAYGLRQAVKKITPQTSIIFIAPQLFLLSNYTYTDWLVRGAMAEFSALMVVPWLLYWCLILVVDRHFSLWIVPVLFVLYMAHNTMALYSLIPLTIAYAIFLTTQKKSNLPRIAKKSLLAVGLFVLLMTPQLVLQKAFIKDYNPSKVTQSGFEASENFLPAKLYVYNGNYQWLERPQDITVQVDIGTVIIICGGTAFLLVNLIGRRKKAFAWLRKQVAERLIFVLFLPSTVFIVLQLHYVKQLYQHIGLLQYLQFPWRLLAFITPLSMLVAVFVIIQTHNTRIATGLLFVWALPFLIFSPIWQQFQYGFITPKMIEGVIAARPSGTGSSLMGIGEYLPRIYYDNKEVGTLDTLQLYADMYHQGRQTAVLEGNCTVTQTDRYRFEPLILRFKVTCEGPGVIALPISYNNFTQITSGSNPKKSLTYFRKPTDPRILMPISKCKDTIIDVKLPTIGRMIANQST